MDASEIAAAFDDAAIPPTPSTQTRRSSNAIPNTQSLADQPTKTSNPECRKRRLSASQTSSSSTTPPRTTTALTLEDLLPRQAITVGDEQTSFSYWEETFMGIEDVGDFRLPHIHGNNVARPPINLRLARLLRRIRLQTLRYRGDALALRCVNPILQERMGFNNPPGYWRPSALLLYHRTQNSPHGSESPSHGIKTSYIPLFCPRGQGGSDRNISPAVKPFLPYHISQSRDVSSETFKINGSHHWPEGRMAVELFEQITDYLSRDDIKNMRLVNREFEYGVSSVLFRTAVVPFNTELYDMIESKPTAKPDLKGKGKAIDLEGTSYPENAPGPLHWENPQKDTDNKVYKGHGLRVFSGFGKRILKYGMSFEVEEDALARPPQKTLLEPKVSFWGGYEWPHEQYRRFADRAGLEQTADETSKMKQAFSHLTKVQQLALSIDSGLGWLRGPDVSIKSRVFQQPPPVFGNPGRVPDKLYQEREDLWTALVASHRRCGLPKGLLMTSTLCKKEISKPLADLPTINTSPFASVGAWLSMEDRVIADASTEVMYHTTGKKKSTAPSPIGVLYAQPEPDWERDEMTQIKLHPINPKELTKEQKEWLLETEWAQRAFMMSYMLAVVDNPTTFTNVHTLNLARMSSRYVALLNRADFWAALPGLKDVVIKVIPDWRNCCKDSAGFVKTPPIDPTEALMPFNMLLDGQVGKIGSIVSLTVGWISGGEHGEGIYARNQQLLPAPIIRYTNPSSTQQDNVLTFPFVEHLTLTNCWITPPAILGLVEQSRDLALEKLTFDSVSLTAHPKFPAGLNALANAQLGNQQNAQIQGQNPGQGAVFGLPQAPAQIPNPFQGQNLQVGNALPNFPVVPNGMPGGLAGQPVNPPPQFPNQNQPLQVGNAFANFPGFMNGVPAGFGGHPINQPPQFPNQNQPPLTFLHMLQMHQPGLVQQLAQNWNFNVPPAAAPQLQPQGQANHANSTNPVLAYREGSWPDVIDQISPGRKLYDLTNPSGSANDNNGNGASRSQPQTRLHTLTFRSCGYCRLASPPFDQTPVESPPPAFHPDLAGPRSLDEFFMRRVHALAPHMMSSRDRWLGTIVQWMPEPEVDLLTVVWGMWRGWWAHDEMAEEGAEYDGWARGGTGRFSGIVSADA